MLSLPFMETHRASTALGVGLTNTVYTYSQLFSELNSTRNILLLDVELRVAPLGTTAAQTAYCQLQMEDPATTVSVPVTPVKLLSLTKETIFRARFPKNIGWLGAGSGATAVTVNIYLTLAQTIYFQITVRANIARDYLV